MKQRKPIKKVNKERKERNFVKYYGSVERVSRINRMPCLICKYVPCDNVHTKSKAAGGTYRDIIPLCRVHHNELHNTGQATFQNKYNLNMEAEAALLYDLIGEEDVVG